MTFRKHPAFTAKLQSTFGPWRTAILGLLFVGTTSTSVAQLSEAQFAACLTDLAVQARELGLPDQVVEEVIPGLQVQNRVVRLDRSQPEFVQTFGQYLAIRVTDTRIERGREQLSQNATLLQLLHETYGVPGQYLMAFWGLESNFGGYLGNLPTLDSLATLACDQRRSAFFTGEFLTALELMVRERFTPEQMQGSWAGAVGHTQFLPSNYMRYAVDGDGDNTIDLWRSEADALSSAANFLEQLGWVPDLRWGREVLIPEGFDYTLAGRSHWLPLTEWRSLGIRRANGQDLAAPEDIDAALLVPAGAEGPAFLVYPNFEVIMRWNRSESYALSVGLLADAIAGLPGLVNPPPDGDGVRYADIKNIQLALADRGFDPGPADGIWGPGSRQALSEFEQSTGRIADGFPDDEVLQALLED